MARVTMEMGGERGRTLEIVVQVDGSRANDMMEARRPVGDQHALELPARSLAPRGQAPGVSANSSGVLSLARPSQLPPPGLSLPALLHSTATPKEEERS